MLLNQLACASFIVHGNQFGWLEVASSFQFGESSKVILTSGERSERSKVGTVKDQLLFHVSKIWR